MRTRLMSFRCAALARRALVPSTFASARFVLSDSMAGMNKELLSKDAINAAVFRRLSERDFDAIDKIYDAFMEYFNHIKFRKGWDKPKFEKDAVDPYLREAAEYVFRVRQYLDRGRPGEPTLRMLDGDSQKFLHSETAAKLVKEDGAAFVTHIVHAALSDAKGYVEGLNSDAINVLVTRLQKHRYCPADHLRHVMLEGLEAVDAINMEPADPAKPFDYVVEGTPEDKSWRAAIDGMYGVLLAAQRAGEHRAAGPPKPTATVESDAKADK